MRRLAEIVWWTIACGGIWLLTQSSVTTDESLVAFAAAVLCALAAAGARTLVGGRWTVRLGWARWLVRLPASTVVETGQVLWAAVRRRPGRHMSIDLPQGEPDDVTASRQGWGALALSASPGSYVVDADPEQCRLRVHRLGRGAPAAVRISPAGG